MGVVKLIQFAIIDDVRKSLSNLKNSQINFQTEYVKLVQIKSGFTSASEIYL